MKFKAKPTLSKDEAEKLTGQKLDKEGYISGYYVDGYIVGDFVECNDEYTSLKFWCEVDKSTLVQEIDNEDLESFCECCSANTKVKIQDEDEESTCEVWECKACGDTSTYTSCGL